MLYKLFDGQVTRVFQAMDALAGWPAQSESKPTAPKAPHGMITQAMAAEPLVASRLIASSQAIVTRLPATGTTLPRWWIIKKLGLADGAWPNGPVIILRVIDI